MARRGGNATTVEPRSAALILVYIMWALVIFDVHRWLGAVGPSIIGRSLTLLYLILLGTLVVRGPALAPSLKAWMLVPPFLAFVLVSIASALGAINVGRARNIAEALTLYYLLVLATLVFVRRPRQTLPILLMFPLQFAWWALHGRASGLVRWHYQLANYDGFGALMVLGIGICFYFGMAASKKWLKRLSFALAGYCVLGIVASEARGAALMAAVVVLVIWYRSPRKMLTAGALVLGFVIVLVGSAVLFPGGGYFQEIMSVFEQGTHSGTGGHRWALWKAALRVFLDNPIFGAGGGNYGIYVVQHYGVEAVGDYYSSASKLWNRNLHSVYVQILAEYGTAGSLVYIWMVIDFWKRNLALRSPSFVQAWRASTGGGFDLRYLSYALELGMIGYLATGAVYAQLEHHWFFTLLGANLMLYWTLRQALPPPAPRRVQRSPASGRRARRRRTATAPAGGSVS